MSSVESQEQVPMPGLIARVCSLPFVAAIWIYRFTLSPIIGGQCRYMPTCSQYGLDAYRLHGPIRGTKLTIGRILRCHPLAKGGYDPVEIPESKQEEEIDLP
jgi:putative membrane protein insertion efficiency factor